MRPTSCPRLILCRTSSWSYGWRPGLQGSVVSVSWLRRAPQVRNMRETNAALRSRVVEVWRRIASLENREGAFLWELGCLPGA